MSSILLVEDHVILAQAVASMLQLRGGFEVAGVATDAEMALEMLSKISVDLVLVDVSLPKINGIELVAEIGARYPGLPCLMLSGHVTRRYVDRSLEAGARGYLVKDDLDGLVEGVQRVLDGGVYLSQQIADP